MEVENAIKIVHVLKALADETRLSIVRKLARGNGVVCGCDVTACSSVKTMSQPTMSHHFNKLVEAGVVIEEKRGTQKFYALDTAMLEAIGIDVHKL